MVALHALNTASTLLQQITGSTGSAAQQRNTAPSIVPAAVGVSTTTGSAAKSVSSAIFNAVADTSEKQDKTVKAVLDFIDRDYTNIEEKFPSLVSLYAERPETRDAVARVKEVGAKLKEQVLADPEGVHKLVEQIKASRPTMSMDGVIGIMIAELGNQNGSQPSAIF